MIPAAFTGFRLLLLDSGDEGQYSATMARFLPNFGETWGIPAVLAKFQLLLLDFEDEGWNPATMDRFLPDPGETGRI
jgi:hypothetical protein